MDFQLIIVNILCCFVICNQKEQQDALNFLLVAKELKKTPKSRVPVLGWISLLATVLFTLQFSSCAFCNEVQLLTVIF